MKNKKTFIRRILPPWLRGPWGAIAICSILYVIVYLAWIYFHWGGEKNVTLIGDLFYLPLELVTIVVLLRTAMSPELSQRQRRAWWFLGLALVSYFVADLSWSYIELILGEPPLPSVADIFYLTFIPLALAGLLNLADPMRARRRYDKQRYWIDLAITALAATMLVWHFVVANTLVENTGDLTALLFAAAYPVGDLILIAGLLAVWLRRPEANTRSVLGWVLFALLCFIGSDLAFAYTGLQGTYASGSWVDAGWTIAYLFLELAALRQLYHAPMTGDSRWSRIDQIGRWVLSGMVILALGLVVYLGLVNGFFWGTELSWLTVGALLVVLLVGWRFFGTRGFTDLSLSNKLIASFLLVTLIPLVGLVYSNALTARQNLTESANLALSAAASAAAEDVDGFLAQGLNNVRIASQLHVMEEYLALPPSERLGSETEKGLYRDLQSIASLDTTYIDAVGLMDRFGRDVADTATGEVGSNKSTHRYISEPMRTNLPYTTVQFSPTTKRFSLYFSAPVHDANGSIFGVLRVRYNAAILQKIVSQALAEQGIEAGDIILLDENHIRLADSSAPKLILKSVVPLPAEKIAQLQTENRFPSGLPAEELSTNLPEFEQGLNNIDNQPIFTGETLPEELDVTIEGEVQSGDQIVATKLETQHWLAVAAQPQNFYLAPVAEQTRSTGLTVLIIAVVVALAALAMAQTISNPIVQLRNAANQIAGGNLQAQAPVHSRDETGQLATAFNEMTSQILQRTRAVETSVEVSRRISSILDLGQLVKEVVEQLQSAFDYYHAHIYLLDEKGENLVMAGGTGEAGRALLERGHKIPRGRGLVGRAADTKETVLVPDTSQDPNWLPNSLLPETKSEIAVPILAGEQVLGVLDVQNNTADSLRQLDADLIRSVANQAAVAIQNIRQYEETRKAELTVTKRANELELASRVATAAATYSDSDRLLQEVVDLTKQTFRLYHAHIYLLNEMGDTLELASGAGEIGRRMVLEGRRIPLSREQSLVARAARERHGFYVNNVRSDPDFLPHPLLPDTSSELAVPMIVGENVIGVFDVQSNSIGYFTNEDIRIQSTLAAQVSVALQNARSFDSAKRQAEHEAALNVIGQKIQSATSVEAVLQIAARELGHALGAPLTVAQLGMKSPGRNGDDYLELAVK